jgi:hypothetical protein
MKPNPGSDEAIKLGCSCPQMDNAHGRRNDGLFWIVADCPVHGCRPVAMTQHQLARLAQAERMMQV